MGLQGQVSVQLLLQGSQLLPWSSRESNQFQQAFETYFDNVTGVGNVTVLDAQPVKDRHLHVRALITNQSCFEAFDDGVALPPGVCNGK